MKQQLSSYWNEYLTGTKDTKIIIKKTTGGNYVPSIITTNI